jgi:hypothetical protein
MVVMVWGNYHFEWKLPFMPEVNVQLAAEQAKEAASMPGPPAPQFAGKNAAGEKVKDAVWEFLRKNGLSREQASGVMGNIQAESGFRPSVVEYGSGIGYGLCQWSYGRRAALRDSVPSGKKISDLDYQLDYMFREMHVRVPHLPEYQRFANEWDLVKAQGTVEDALVAFHNEFERSHLMNLGNSQAIRRAVIGERLGLAHESYNNPRRFP